MEIIERYGICNWYPEHGSHLVSTDNFLEFINLKPAGKIFKCISIDDKWCSVIYGEKTFKIDPVIYHIVPDLKFYIGQSVWVKTKNSVGTIIDVFWHFKNEMPVYFINFEGKRSSRRYSESELSHPHNIL